MSSKDTVKAREHHGADSLNLTIPAELVREKDIDPGDIFEINIVEDGNKLVLKYRRVYKSG